jgi:hypothetical protein
MLKLVRPLCGTLALVTLASTAAAQSPTVTGSLTAEANVSSALSFGPAVGLNFGTVFPGIPKQVLPSGTGAGKFSVSGNPNAQVEFWFDLPAHLSSGLNQLIIDASSWAACRNTTDATAGCIAFTPTAIPGGADQTSLLHSTNGTLFIYIGATVAPAGIQAPGVYTGTVGMNVRYTGL